MKSLRRHWPLLGYLLIVALAAVLRFAALTRIPYTLWVDEAWFELRGRDVLHGVNLLPTVDTVFASGNSPYQIYASAAVQALGLPAAYSSRWASASAGVLGVLLSCPLLLTLFKDELADAQRVVAAMTGMAILATLFASLLLSRDGTQNTACVAATILVMLGLYRTLDHHSGKWALFTGAMLALAQTTYEAALALPIVIVVYTALRAGSSRGRARLETLRLGGLILMTALVLYSPLLLYYLQNQNVVFSRLAVTQNVTTTGDWADSVMRALEGFARVWWGIAVRGDRLAGQNLAGRPLFDPFACTLLGIGLAYAAWQSARSTAAQLLLTWAVVMSVPSAITLDPPAFGRMLPMTPALAGLAGWGAAVLWGAAAKRGPWPGRGVALGLVSGLVLAGAVSARTYFVDWSNDPRLFDARQAGARRTAEAALDFAHSGDVFLSPRSEPLVQYTFSVMLNGTQVQTFDATPACLPYAHNRPAPTVYGVIQVMDPNSLPTLQAAYPAGTIVDTVMHPDGYAYSLFFRVPASTPAPAPARAVTVEFEHGLRLKGYDVVAAARPGETLTLKLYWETSQPLPEDLTGFVHIGRGAQSRPLIAQHDAPLCPDFTTSRWTPGYVYIETRSFTLVPDAPSGLYDIRVGVYRPSANARLAILQSDVPVENNRAVLTPFEVP